MTLTRTAAQLTADVRNRADHLVGTFRSDTVLRRYLSESCRSLVSMLVDEYEEMYWSQSAVISTTANVGSTSEHIDMWKLIAMRVTLDGVRARIPRADLDEIDVEGTPENGWSAGCWPKHRLMGRRIVWTPTPRAVHSVALYFVPTTIFTDSVSSPKNEFTDPTDLFDGVFGWEQWVVLDAAIKLLNDEKKDATPLIAERSQREAEIRTAAANQASDDAPKVRDRWNPGGSPTDRMPPGGWY